MPIINTQQTVDQLINSAKTAADLLVKKYEYDIKVVQERIDSDKYKKHTKENAQALAIAQELLQRYKGKQELISSILEKDGGLVSTTRLHELQLSVNELVEEAKKVSIIQVQGGNVNKNTRGKAYTPNQNTPKKDMVKGQNVPLINANLQRQIDDINKLVQQVQNIETVHFEQPMQVISQQAQQLDKLGSVIGTLSHKNFKERPVIGTDVQAVRKIQSKFEQTKGKLNVAVKMATNRSGKAVSPMDISKLGQTADEVVTALENAIYYDLETVGQIGVAHGNNRIASTQISMSQRTKQGKKIVTKTENGFIQLQRDIEERLRNNLQTVHNGGILNSDAQRELLSFANLIKKNESITTSGKYRFNDSFVLSAQSGELLDAIKNGIDLVSKSGSANNLYSSTQDAWEKLASKFSGSLYAGHNIYDFDDRVLELEGVKIEKSIVDTLNLARQYLTLNSKNVVNGKEVQLKGYGMDEFAEFFGLKMDESVRHSAGYDTQLNQEIGKALAEYIMKMAPNLSEAEKQGVKVSKGQIGKATKNYWKQNQTSFRINNGVIPDDKWGDWLLKANEFYQNSGIVNNNDGTYTAKLTGLTSKDEVFLTGSLEQLNQTFTRIFGEGFSDYTSKSSQDKLAQESAQNIVASLFKTGGNSYLKFKKMQENNAPELQYLKDNFQEAFDYLNNLAKKVETTITGNTKYDVARRQLAWEKLGAEHGVIGGTPINAGALDKFITQGASQTFTGLKQAYIDFIQDNFSKNVQKELIAILNSESFSEKNSEAKIKSGEITAPFYNMGALLFDKIVDSEDPNGILDLIGSKQEVDLSQFSKQNNSSWSQNIDNIISNAVKLVNPVDIASKIKNNDKRMSYTGKYATNRLKNFGYSDKTAKEFSSMVDSGGIYSIQRTLDEIVLEANRNGLTTDIAVTPDGDIQLGFYPTYDYYNIRDASGKADWDKMAKVTIGLADAEGTVNINGVAKTNFGIMRADRDGNAYQITAMEQQALDILDVVKSPSFRNNLIQKGDTEKASKSLRAGARKAFESASTTFAGKVNGDVAEVSKIGSTQSQRMFRQSAVKWEQYLKDILANAQNIAGADSELAQMSGHQVLEDMLQIISILNAGLDASNSEFSDSQKKLLENDYIGKALKQVADKMKMTWMSTKEEQVTTGLITHQLGSGDFEFAGWARDEASRATSQGYNAVNDIEKSLRDGIAQINNFADGRIDSNATDRMTYRLGFVNDNILAKVREVMAKELADTSGKTIEEELKNIPLLSVSEGGLITFSDIAKSMQGFYTQKYEMEEEAVDSYIKTITKGLTEGQTIENIIKDGSLILGKRNGENIWANAGDRIKITKGDGNYQFSVSRKIGSEIGTKVVGGGYRVALNGILDSGFRESLIRALKEVTGKDYTGVQFLTEDTEVKATNLGDLFQQRLGYFINKYAETQSGSDAQQQARNKVIEIVKDKLTGSGVDLIKKMFGIDSKGNLTTFNGKITDTLLTEQEQKQILEDSGFVDLFGENSYLSQIGKGLFGNDWADVNATALVDTVLNLAMGEYPYHDAIGPGDDRLRENLHRVKLGTKELNAVSRLAGILKGETIDTQGINLGNSTYAYDAQKSSRAIEQLLDDLKERQSDITKQKRKEAAKIAEQLEQTLLGKLTKEDNDLIIRNGQDLLTGTGNELSIERFTRSISEWKKGGISQLDYENTPVGIINTILKESGLDKAVLDLSGLGIRRNIKNADGQITGFAELNNVIIPQIQANQVDDIYMLDEINKAASDLFRVLNNKEGKPIEYKKKVEDAVNNYLDTLRNVLTDKNGGYFNAMTSITPPNAAAMKAIGINRSTTSFTDSSGQQVQNVNDFFQNTAFISIQQAKDMLRAIGLEGDENKNKRQVHLQELMNLAKTVKVKLEKEKVDKINDWAAKEESLESFRTVEKELIDAIIKQVTFNEDFSQEQQNYLVEFFHRYPSIDGLDEVLGKVMVREGLDNGTIQMGQGLTEKLKGDYDGDKIRTWLGLGGNKGDSFNEELFARTEQGKRALESMFSKIAVKVSRGSANDSKDIVFGSVLEDSEAQASKVQDLMTALKSKKYTGLMSKFNKKNIGSLSNSASDLRALLYDTGLDERGIVAGNVDSLKNAAYSALLRMVFEQLEQDSISSKKISARLIAHAEKVAKKNGLGNNLETYEKIVTDEISKLAELVYGGKFEEAITKAINIGIFENGEVDLGGGKTGVMGLSTAKARATLNTLAVAFGETGEQILKEIGAVKDESGDYYTGVQQSGLYTILQKAQENYYRRTGEKIQFARRNHNVNNPTHNRASARYTDILDLMAQGLPRATTLTPDFTGKQFNPELELNNRELAENVRSQIKQTGGIEDQFKDYLARQLSGMTEDEQLKFAVKILPEFELGQEAAALAKLNKLIGEDHIKAVQAATQAEQGKIAVSGKLTTQLGKEEQAMADVNAEAKNDNALSFLQYRAQIGYQPPELENVEVNNNGGFIKDNNGRKVDFTPTSINRLLVPYTEDANQKAKTDFIKELIKRGDTYSDIEFTTENIFGTEENFKKAQLNAGADIIGQINHLIIENIGKSGKSIAELSSISPEDLMKQYLLNDTRLAPLQAGINELGIDLRELHVGDNANSLILGMKEAGLEFTGLSEEVVALKIKLADGTEKVIGAITDMILRDSNGNLVVGDIKTTAKIADQTVGQLSIETHAWGKELEKIQEYVRQNPTGTKYDERISKILGKQINDQNRSDILNTRLRNTGAVLHMRNGVTNIVESPTMNTTQLGHYIGFADRKAKGYALDTLDDINSKTLFNGGISPYGGYKGYSEYGEMAQEFSTLIPGPSTDKSVLANYFRNQEKVDAYKKEVRKVKEDIQRLSKNNATGENDVEIKKLEEKEKKLGELIDSYKELRGVMDIAYQRDEKGYYVDAKGDRIKDENGKEIDEINTNANRKLVQEQGVIQQLIYKNNTTGIRADLTEAGRQSFQIQQNVAKTKQDLEVSTEEEKKQVDLAKEYVANQKELDKLNEEAIKRQQDIDTLSAKEKTFGLSVQEIIRKEDLTKQQESYSKRITELEKRQEDIKNSGFDYENETFNGKSLNSEAGTIVLKEKIRLAREYGEEVRRQQQEEEALKQKKIENDKKRYVELYKQRTKLILDKQKTNYDKALVDTDTEEGKAKLDAYEKKLVLLEERLSETNDEFVELTKNLKSSGNLKEIFSTDDFQQIRFERGKTSSENTGNYNTELAKRKDNAEKVSSKQADNYIKQNVNNLKQIQKLERDMARTQKQLDSADETQKSKYSNYLQSLAKAKAILEAQTLQYDAQNGILNGIKLSDEQRIAYETKIRSMNATQALELEKINSSYKAQLSLVDQLFKALRGTFANVSLYSVVNQALWEIRSRFRELIQYTKELDSAMVDIQIASGMDLSTARKNMIELNELAREIGMTTKEMAEAQNDWLRAGYEGAEAMDLTRASAYLAQLGMIETADATSYLISSLKGWKLEANEVMNVVDKLVSVDMAAAISAGKKWKLPEHIEIYGNM